jgi:hypothetical protein
MELLAGTPNIRPIDMAFMASAVICVLLATGVRVALARAGVGKLARSLIAMAVFFSLLFATCGAIAYFWTPR